MANQLGLTPEYIAEYCGGKLIALASAMIPILLIFVSLRFHARRLVRPTWRLDDYLVLISLIIQIGLSALAICFVKYGGVGRHVAAWEVIDPSMTTNYFKWLLAVSFYYFHCVAWPKLSILAFYNQVFPLRSYRITIIIVAAIVAVTGIVTPIMCLNLCHPFRYFWDRTIPGGKCMNEQVFYQFASLPNILTDIVMLVLPIPVVWRLQTSLNIKTALTVAFATGSLGLATSIIRFNSFFKGNAVEDGTWDSTDFMLWTILEPGVYLIASCLVAYRPLFARVFGGPRASVSSEGSDATPGTGAHKAWPRKPSCPASDSWLFHDTKVSITTSTMEKDEPLATIKELEGSPSRDGASLGHILVKREYEVTTMTV